MRDKGEDYQLRTGRQGSLRKMAYKASMQRQAETKRLNMEMDRVYKEKMLEASRNFLLQEQDKVK